MKHIAAICLLILAAGWPGPVSARPLAMANVNAAEFSTPQNRKKREVLAARFSGFPSFAR